MIGVDTNVLLRLLIVDDPRQNELARTFFAERSPESPAYVSLIVLAELGWVLGKKYKYPTAQIGGAIRVMLDSPDFAIEQRGLIESCLEHFDRAGMDFADLLIGAVNEAAKCSATVTFDREVALSIRGMELLA